jgi:hypothetical protein
VVTVSTETNFATLWRFAPHRRQDLGAQATKGSGCQEQAEGANTTQTCDARESAHPYFMDNINIHDAARENLARGETRRSDAAFQMLLFVLCFGDAVLMYWYVHKNITTKVAVARRSSPLRTSCTCHSMR